MHITLPRPDDMHLHLRDGAQMADAVRHSARTFARAVIMPNLKPPVRTVDDANAYRARILNALPEGCDFTPMMTLYLTPDTHADDIAQAAKDPNIIGVKLYPAGATTHSDSGVSDLTPVYPVLEAMQRHRLPLLVHGEVTRKDVDFFARESVFIDTVLDPLLRDFPELRVVCEHITTQHAADYVTASAHPIAATITPQHLLYNRNVLFEGGLHPHYYCLPILKLERDRQALVAAATGDNPKFFLGTDSAPHPRGAKESDCGCAGIFSAHAALAFYAEAFEQAGQLDRLADFASRRGADFYALPRNTATLTLEKRPHRIPHAYPFGDSEVVPLRAGETLQWQLTDSASHALERNT